MSIHIYAYCILHSNAELCVINSCEQVDYTIVLTICSACICCQGICVRKHGLCHLVLQLKKKVRVRKAADEEGAGLDLAALEAEAAAAGKSELGSRKDTASRAAQAQKAQIADEAQRQSK